MIELPVGITIPLQGCLLTPPGMFKLSVASWSAGLGLSFKNITYNSNPYRSIAVGVTCRLYLITDSRILIRRCSRHILPAHVEKVCIQREDLEGVIVPRNIHMGTATNQSSGLLLHQG